MQIILTYTANAHKGKLFGFPLVAFSCQTFDVVKVVPIICLLIYDSHEAIT